MINYNIIKSYFEIKICKNDKELSKTIINLAQKINFLENDIEKSAD